MALLHTAEAASSDGASEAYQALYKVMVVDDSTVIRGFIRRLLE